MKNEPLQPHEQRVVDERTELDEKRTKLRAFIKDSAVFRSLGSCDQSLLLQQEQTMANYSCILTARIDRF